jgi:hypothetical protein
MKTFEEFVGDVGNFVSIKEETSSGDIATFTPMLGNKEVYKRPKFTELENFEHLVDCPCYLDKKTNTEKCICTKGKF